MLRQSGQGSSGEMGQGDLVHEDCNRWNGFPTCFILSASFLLVSYSITHGRPNRETPIAEVQKAMVKAAMTARPIGTEGGGE